MANMCKAASNSQTERERERVSASAVYGQVYDKNLLRDSDMKVI